MPGIEIQKSWPVSLFQKGQKEGKWEYTPIRLPIKTPQITLKKIVHNIYKYYNVNINDIITHKYRN